MSTQKTADEKPRRGWRSFLFGGSSSSVDDEEVVPERGVTARKGRATPGRRAATDEDEGNVVVRSVGGVREYFEGVQSELNKVTWPTREETIRLSGIVLVTTVISSLILGLVALSYSELFRLGINQPLIFLGFFVAVLVIGFVVYRRSNQGGGPSY
ncbi:MAG: preprotein translocase subunit SecE [Anaerolineae bacterium]|nr:preprotein translocase subunit SecE [Anaerolineae bacterium]